MTSSKLFLVPCRHFFPHPHISHQDGHWMLDWGRSTNHCSSIAGPTRHSRANYGYIPAPAQPVLLGIGPRSWMLYNPASPELEAIKFRERQTNTLEPLHPTASRTNSSHCCLNSAVWQALHRPGQHEDLSSSILFVHGVPLWGIRRGLGRWGRVFRKPLAPQRDVMGGVQLVPCSVNSMPMFLQQPPWEA